MTESSNQQPKCTCPCIDCIEGNHCGGEYWWPPEPILMDDSVIVEEPQLIGICEHINWDTIQEWDDVLLWQDDCEETE